jgi:hypothetical protein
MLDVAEGFLFECSLAGAKKMKRKKKQLQSE